MATDDGMAPSDEWEDWEEQYGEEIYCHACSKAGGAERAIYHLPPACEDLPSTEPKRKRWSNYPEGCDSETDTFFSC